MNQSAERRPKQIATEEVRRLTELARAAGLGDAPDEALRWHDDALSLLGTDEPSPLLADVLRWQGTVLRDRGRASDAEPLYRRSLAIALSLGYQAGRAHALNCLAGLAQRRGDLVLASNQLADALEVAELCDETRLVGMIQQNLGVLADIRGNPTAALGHYSVSLRIFESSRDRQPMCRVLNNLGYLHLKQGRFDEARQTFERGRELARERGDLMTEGILEENLADVSLSQDQIDAAHSSILRALEIAEQRNDNVRRAAALKLMGAYERLTDRATAAVDTLRHALTLAAIGEDALLGGEVLYQFGNALHASGDPRGATEVWKTALDTFERIAARDWVTRTWQRLTGGPTGRYL